MNFLAKNKKLIFSQKGLVVLAFVLGFATAYFIRLHFGDEGIASDISSFREKAANYSFINPLLFYEVPSSINSPHFLSIVSQLKKTVADFNSQEKNSKISIYYRDLNSGQWFGINENEAYTPSSLLKVAVMIAYFKQIEQSPPLSIHTIMFSQQIKDVMDSVPYDSGTDLIIGHKYSVEDLINRMIIDSDNGATYTLLSEINNKTLDQIYASLDLKNPVNMGRSYTITPQSYVSFLRILYNATYLNRTMSEKALALLARTNFQDGIAASIPRTIKIAHKYGEAVSTKNGQDIDFVELHDCGIIYHPRNPYILCVMSKGDKLEDLSRAIKTISTEVYKFVEAQR